MLLATPPGFSVNPLSCKMPCAMLQDACVATPQHQPSGLMLCPLIRSVYANLETCGKKFWKLFC